MLTFEELTKQMAQATSIEEMAKLAGQLSIEDIGKMVDALNNPRKGVSDPEKIERVEEPHILCPSDMPKTREELQYELDVEKGYVERYRDWCCKLSAGGKELLRVLAQLEEAGILDPHEGDSLRCESARRQAKEKIAKIK